MAAIIRGDSRTLSKLLAGDAATINPGLINTEYDLLYNEALLDWFVHFGERLKIVANFVTLAINAIRTVSVATPYEVVSLELSGPDAPGVASIPLERDGVASVRLDQDRLGGAGVPRRAAWIAEQDNSLKYQVLTYPLPDAAYVIQAWVKNEFTLPTADSGASGTPDLSLPDSYQIARLVAVRACPLLGNDAEYQASIAQDLPQKWRDRMKWTSAVVREKPTMPQEQT